MLLCLGDAKDIQNIPEHCGNSQIGKIESSGNCLTIPTSLRNQSSLSEVDAQQIIDGPRFRFSTLGIFGY
jgi:hypothetical protein